LQVQPLIAALYRRALPLGWGFWASLVGNLALATIALANAFEFRGGPGRLA
jgi:hypothetical protein